MKKRRHKDIVKDFYIPIYNSELIVHIVDDFKNIIEEYNLPGADDYNAITFSYPDKDGINDYHVVFRRDLIKGSIIAHESLHVVSFLFRDKGIKYDEYNDEPIAYLLGWVFKQINEVVHKYGK